MIYFMQSPDGGAVKIGFTTNVDGRLKELQFYYRRPLRVLCTMDGDRKTEFSIHHRFRHLRFGKKEQFQPAPDLMEFIGHPWLAKEGYKDVRPMPRTAPPGPVKNHPGYWCSSWETANAR